MATQRLEISVNSIGRESWRDFFSEIGRLSAGVRNSTGAVVSENRPNGVATVAEFVDSVPVRDHGEPGATGESGSVSRARADTARRGGTYPPGRRAAARPIAGEDLHTRLPPPAVA